MAKIGLDHRRVGEAPVSDILGDGLVEPLVEGLVEVLGRQQAVDLQEGLVFIHQRAQHSLLGLEVIGRRVGGLVWIERMRFGQQADPH